MKPTCVLGILDTPRGHEIAKGMLEWLRPIYNVYPVIHNGQQFELPALQRARNLAFADEPVLYLHTRGAVNTYNTTAPTHRMWREEFGHQWQKYYDILLQHSKPLVLSPFVDNNRTTRYNGIFANAAAWQRAILEPTKERHDYEHIWRGDDETKVLGMLVHAKENRIEDIRDFLLLNYGK